MTQTAGLQNGDGVVQAAYQKLGPRSVPDDTLGAFVSRLATLPLMNDTYFYLKSWRAIISASAATSGR